MACPVKIIHLHQLRHRRAQVPSSFRSSAHRKNGTPPDSVSSSPRGSARSENASRAGGQEENCGSVIELMATSVIAKWSVDEVFAWVSHVHSDEVAELFRHEGIDGDLVLTLTDENLEEMGVADPSQRVLILERV